MHSKFKPLDGLDKEIVAYGAVIVLSIAGFVGLTLKLGEIDQTVTRRGNELAELQGLADRIVIPTDEEPARWTRDQDQMEGMLLADAELPALLQDVTRLATLNRLDRFELATEAFVIGADADLAPDEVLMQAAGIRRHVTVTIGFSGDYRRAAEFVRDVANLPRLVEFVSIQLARGPSTIAVTMSLRVYQGEAAA